MKFADVTPGRSFTLGPVTVTQDEIIRFAGQYDDQWFHTDPELAGQGPFHGPIASGWYTCALAMQLVSRQLLAGSESYASPGLSYVHWPNPVRPGDLLTLDVKVHESRVSQSRTWLGVMRWQWVNQHEAPVLDLEATSMFRIGGSGAGLPSWGLTGILRSASNIAKRNSLYFQQPLTRNFFKSTLSLFNYGERRRIFAWSVMLDIARTMDNQVPGHAEENQTIKPLYFPEEI